MVNRLRQLINKWCFEDDDINLVECEEANLIVDRLEKALDKACEELEQFEYTLSNYHYNEHKSKEQWKEYLLKEVGKQG